MDWLEENPQTEMNTPDAGLLQHVQEVTQAYEQKLAKDDENDLNTYNIYSKHTGGVANCNLIRGRLGC